MRIPGIVAESGYLAASALSILLTGFVVAGGVVAVPYVTRSSPVQDYSLRALEPAAHRTLVLHGINGRPFANRGGCVAEPVSLEEVPPHVVDALLSMEDRRFYYHFGVDPIGIARAALINRAAGRIVQGGSTLTQQLVKYSLLSNDRTLERKRREAWLALSLELRLSKDEILERYLSSAYFGQGCYGLRAAAKRYFDVPVSELSIPQAAYLVALLKAPTALNRDPEAAKARAEAVFDAMIDNGKLDAEQREMLVSVLPRIETSETVGSYYADWVARTANVPRDGNYAPLPVHTSFDPELQRLAEATMANVLGKQGKKRRATQAAMVVMRPDGRVLAMVGGRDYDQSTFNRAVQARRQPGSSFKLFVYLAGLRAGLNPNSLVVDRPVRVGRYAPRNFGNRYRGKMRLYTAFALSINTVAVQISEAVRRKPVIQAARDLGITTPLKTRPSLALGAFEVTLLEMTSAYAAVAAGAYPVKPWAITGFEDVDVDVTPPEGAGRWRLNERQYMRTLLLSAVQNGSGRRAKLPFGAFGKTGTSQSYRDAWFIGFAGNLVVGVWVGNDDSKPMKGVTGGSLPADIWGRFMRKAIKSDGFSTGGLVAAFDAKPRRRKVKFVNTGFLLDFGKPSNKKKKKQKKKGKKNKKKKAKGAKARRR